MAKEAKHKEKGKESKDASGLNFGFGGLSFKNFFEGLEKLVDLADKFKKTGGYTQNKEFSIPLGSKGKEIKGVYGFTVKTMASGEQRIEPFGNIKKTPRGPVVEETREPIVDVFDEKDHIRVVAEVPGVSEEHVEFQVKGDILKLSADHGDRKYSKEVLLPCFVEEKPENVSFKNGIFKQVFHDCLYRDDCFFIADEPIIYFIGGVLYPQTGVQLQESLGGRNGPARSGVFKFGGETQGMGISGGRSFGPGP